MFGDKLYDDVGYPTPTEIPEIQGARTFCIPDSTAWFALVMGCLMQLAEEENWQQFDGGITAEDAAAAAQAIIDSGYEGTCSVDSDIETPMWDDNDGSDADDEIDPASQPWYETLSDWAVTAFLAVSFTPAAAIEFVTTVRQIRLWFRTRDYGAIVNILWDDELIGQVDTYSETPGTVNFDYYAPTASEHTLRVEHSGENNADATPTDDGYAVEILRGDIRLDLFAFVPQIRYDEATDAVQVSYDDGATWTPAPGSDPRHQTRYPPLDTSDPRCDAAANIVYQLQVFVNDATAAIQGGAFAAGVGTTIILWLALFGAFAVLLALAVALADILIAIGYAAIQSAFTSAVYADLLCLVYCRLSADGTITADDLALLQDDINDHIGGIPATVLTPLLSLIGEGGLNNMAATGTQTGDCGDCECEWCQEFTQADIESGLGWLTTGQGTRSDYSRHSTAIANITHVEFDATIVAGTTSGGRGWSIWNNNSASGAPVASGDVTSGSFTFSWDGSANNINGNYLGVNAGGGGSSTITRILLRGTGTEPSWSTGHNC